MVFASFDGKNLKIFCWILKIQKLLQIVEPNESLYYIATILKTLQSDTWAKFIFSIVNDADNTKFSYIRYKFILEYVYQLIFKKLLGLMIDVLLMNAQIGVKLFYKEGYFD